MTEKKPPSFLPGSIPGFPAVLYLFAALEFAILITCILLSANEDIIRIYSPEGAVVYENTYNMSHINEFKQVYGIDSFKTEGFRLVRTEKENPFPTRAWIALSICIPLALTLFVVFIVRVYDDMVNKDKPSREKSPPGEKASAFEETRFEKLFSTLGRLNIYSLGCTAILIGFLYWMVPDLLIYVGRISYQTLSELKWVLLAAVVAAGLYLVLKMVLSYKTKTEIIRQQAQIQQNRDRLTIEARTDVMLPKPPASPSGRRSGGPPEDE